MPRKGQPRSEETRRKISAALQGKGHPQSAETKQKIRDARRGRPSPHRGHPLSAETKTKISAVLRGRETSEAHRAKLSAALRGRTRQPRSAETKAKIGAALRGRTFASERRQNLTAAHRGRQLSPAHRERIRAGQQKRWAATPVTQRKQQGQILNKGLERLMSKRGPNWRRSLLKQATAAKRGKPASLTLQRHLISARAARRPRSAELSRLMMVHAQHPLQHARNADQLLVMEYQATAADAKRFLRKIIEKHDRRVDYTLARIAGYLAAGHTMAWIATKIERKMRRVQQLVRLLETADAEAKATQPPGI